MRILRRQFILLLCAVSIASAQESDSSASGFRIGGSAVLSGDLYSMNAQPSGSVAPRLPESLYRILVSLNLSYGPVSIPFRLMLSSRETNVVTPLSNSTSLSQQLLNPLNTISLSPKLDWAQLYIGTHTQTFSELSGGDQQIFGLGFDLTPGKFRIAGSAGYTQRAVEVDTVAQNRGAYARTYYALKLGYGGEQKDAMQLGFNIIRTGDDPGSIKSLSMPLVISPDSSNPGFADTIQTRHPLMPVPTEGVLASIDVYNPITDWLSVGGEVAASAYTRDMESPLSNAIASESVLTTRNSTRLDYAGSLSLDINNDWWGINAKALYLRPGFVSLGYPFLQSDRMEFTVNPRLTLFDGDILINGSFGSRTNNLSQTSGATTSQLLLGLTVQAQVSEAFSIGGNYTNFGIRNTVTNDTFRLENISQSFSVTPTYSFDAFSMDHTLSVTYSLDDFTDLNVLSGTLNDNSTRTILGLYSGSFRDIPLSFNLSLSNLVNVLSVGDLNINTGSLSVSARMWKGDVTPTLSASITESKLGNATADVMMGLRFGVMWKILKNLRFNLAATLGKMNYGSSQPGVSFQENRIQTSISMNF